MEQTITLPQDSLGNNKYIYGTYIEMAFHNFFQNMRHIYSLVFGEDIMEEAKRNYVPNNNRTQWDEDYANEPLVWNPMFKRFRYCQPEERQRVEELINRHFPILKAAKDFTNNSDRYNRLDSIEILKRLSKNIRVLRNFYSHLRINLFPNQIETFNMQEELVKGVIEHAYLGAKREVKSRFALDDAAMRCTEQYRYTRRRDEHGRPVMLKEEIRGFKYKLTEGRTSHLTAFGLVFFCSQFLEKKFSKIFTDKLHCIPKADQSVVNEMIAVYRIRLHQEKLYVSKNTDALAFDILTELRRCPKELFEQLSPEEQAKFRILVKDNDDDDCMLMIRHHDRFAHLALKYIDDTKMFDSVRFQVSLGKYFYKFYNKYCIDSSATPRVRALSKNVNGFGRISEIEASRKELWDNCIRTFGTVHKNTPDEEPYVTDHHAQYVINGNRIAMHIFEDSPRFHLPELDDDGVSNLAPTCWLSIYELPAMMMLIHLKGGAFVEDKIKSVVANYKKLFRDVSEGALMPVNDAKALQETMDSSYGGLCVSDIPKDIQDYLTGKERSEKYDFQRTAMNVIDSMIEQTEYKLEQFKEQCRKVGKPKENKFGKKAYVTIQPGKLAAFLAKDIMLFQPNDINNKGKLTGLNFRVMQSMLAQYGNNGYQRDDIERMFISAHILADNANEKANPIVQQIWKRRILPRNTKEFYMAYLEERLVYLRGCKNRDLNTLCFLHADRVRWQKHDEDFYKAKAGRYLHEESNGVGYDKPIELPRGMFDASIREEMMEMDMMKSDACDANKNMSYLIYGYFKKVMCDDCQPMYETGRTYSILNKLYRKSPRDSKIYYSVQQVREALMRNTPLDLRKAIDKHVKSFVKSQRIEEKEHMDRLLRDMKHNETTLKRYRVQDIILFMISMKLLMAEEQDKARIEALSAIRLKDIQTKDVLSQKIRFSITVGTRNGYQKTIFQNDLKLKDYAKFYRFVSDRRMPSLLDHIRSNSVDRTKIEEELSGYDKVHPNILKGVFDYEDKFYREHPGSTVVSDFKDMINGDDRYEYRDKSTLKWIRNSFAHCIYPPYNIIGNRARNQEIPEKALAIADTFEEKIYKNDN